MKKSLKLIVIVLLAAIPVLVLSCDFLLAPLKARTNPLDPNTTIHPPYNVAIRLGNVDGEFGSEITWEWTNDGGETEVRGFVVIRKAGAESSSVYDGVCVYVSETTEDSYYFDTVAGNPDYPAGYQIYYAVYSFAPKWDENTMREDEKLTLDSDGTVRNLQNYDFNGPVSDSAEVWAHKSMPVSADGYVDEFSRNTSDNNFLVASTAVDSATTVGCVRFDLSEPPEGNVILKEKYLVLRTFNDGGAGSIVVSPYAIDWTNVTYYLGNLEVPGAVADPSYDVDLNLGGGEFEQVWVNISDIYDAWTDGSLTNYGLRLMKPENADYSWQFFSVEDGDSENNWPRLNVYYMYE